MVAMVQHLTLTTLLLTTLLIVLISLSISKRKLIQLVHRTRWLMLSILLVYAYSTPGIPYFAAMEQLSPTHEGVQDGVLQLARLLAALAGLAILLDKLNRTQLIAGIHTLLLPLQRLGISPERFAIRLALTLHYAELAMLRKSQRWQDILRGLSNTHDNAPDHTLTLPVYAFKLSDLLLLTLASALLWLAMQ